MAVTVTLDVCYEVVFNDDDYAEADDLWSMGPNEVREYAERSISVTPNMEIISATIKNVTEDAADEPENSVRFPLGRTDDEGGESF